MTNPMNKVNQRHHIQAHFKAALQTGDAKVNVWFSPDEEIIVQVGDDSSRQWTFYIPSDDDGFYYFELWVNGRQDDGRITLKFPYPEA